MKDNIVMTLYNDVIYPASDIFEGKCCHDKYGTGMGHAETIPVIIDKY